MIKSNQRPRRLWRARAGATDRQQIFMQVIATLPNGDDEFTVPEITKASRELLKNPFSPSHATQMLGHLSEKSVDL